MKMRCPVRQSAFSLVEVVIALAIMSFCLIVLLGILPISLTTIKNASEETTGINVISTIVSDLQSTPASTNISPNYQLTLPTALAAGNQPQIMYLDQTGAVLTGSSAAAARYRATITMSSPTLQNTISGTAQVSWPAHSANPTATVESFFALNRN